MARANTRTLLSLDQYAEVMGLNPWEFNQIGKGVPSLIAAGCDTVWFQHPWQKDFLGREEVARAIFRAEVALTHQMNFWPAPQFTVNEEKPYPRPFKRTVFGAMGTPRGQWKALQTRWHKVIGGGILARTKIGDDATIVYSDEDGDGLNETFTVTHTITTETVDEIALYFITADRVGKPIDESWRIRPVSVSIVGTTATITGHKSQMVLPKLTEKTDPDNLDVTVIGNFAVTISVFRTFRDTTFTNDDPNQGTAIWEPPPNCTDNDCTVEFRGVCLGNRDAENGWIVVQEEPVNWPRRREPDRVSLNYLSGVPLLNGRMDDEMAQLVAYLATGWLVSEKCGCERSNRIIRYWRRIPSVGKETARSMTIEEINDNPFGLPTQGALYAWKHLLHSDLKHVVGISI